MDDSGIPQVISRRYARDIDGSRRLRRERPESHSFAFSRDLMNTRLSRLLLNNGVWYSANSYN